MSNVPEPAKVAQDIVSLTLHMSLPDLTMLVVLSAQCQLYNSPTIYMTVGDFLYLTGMSHPTIIKTLKRLSELRLIDVSPHAGPYPRAITFRFDDLEALALSLTVPKVRKRTRRVA